MSPDGRRIFTAGSESGRLWDVESGKPLTPPLPLGGPIHRAAFSLDGRRLLTLSGSWIGGTLPQLQLRVWDTATGAAAGGSLQPGGVLWAAAFAPNGRGVLTVSEDATNQVWLTEWSVATGSPARPLRKLPARISGQSDYWTLIDSAAFSADGRRLVTTFENSARVWEAATGRPLTPSLSQAGAVNGALFSPDGGRLAVQVNGDFLQLWEIRTGRPLGRLIPHGSGLWAAAFSTDGRYLSTASQDQTARIWDAVTGEHITPPLRHHGIAVVAEISPDGRRLITSNERDGVTARLWSLAPDEHPPGDLDRLAQLLTGERIDPSCGPVPVEAHALQSAWSELRAHYPDTFTCPPERALEWHREEAEECEWQQQWAAAVFHYDQILASRPDDQEARNARARANAQAHAASSLPGADGQDQR
jgi:WD40 repeat protein